MAAPQKRTKAEVYAPINDARAVGQILRRAAGCEDKPQQPEPERALTGALRQLQLTAGSLHDAVDAVLARAEPICTPRAPDAEIEKLDSLTHFSAQIDSLTQALDQDDRKLRSLCDRLGV